jgi:lysophospholipase L1-like esterase
MIPRNMADPVPANRAESFGAKLRRLAAAAANNKASQFFSQNPPLRLPAAWAPNAPVQLGEVRAANGSWYVCGKAGITAAAGNGPAARATSALVVDNSVSWAYLCAAPITAASPMAPTIATQVAATPTGLPNFFDCIAFSAAFRVTGAYHTVYSKFFWALTTFNASAAGSSSVTSRISFITDAPKFAIGFTNDSAPVRVLVDGQYVDAGGLPLATGGSPTWLILDFPPAAGRMPREIMVEFTFAHTFAGVAVTPDDSVWAPAATDSVRCVVISDSLFSGSAFGPFLPGGDASSYMARRLGWDDCWNCSVAGTGYVATGSGSYTYGQRIPELLTRKPDIWIFMGSTNDIATPPPAVQAAALAAFKAIRAGGSLAPIIVFGVWSIDNSGLAAIEAAVHAAVTQFADPLRQTFFIPVYGDPVLPWITGAWNNRANADNAKIYIGSDGIHPVETGTMFESVRLAQAIEAYVLPNIP